ncbi:uncharacterized protein BP01DRAFT_378475 [Aspergillus saccharolyticus JOP 1030-1]|uniref:Uncharacterized protein n=1 Tax=Aspergillus saccharolyticus JOP 1030-1 TaxID=1450539 RepID=A0A318ZQS2_9EURO|nr:hypothetical protein BP01DRAFT_378475 [Aspergillus saccharolyticus JOP 1030-1]PYH49866.1 hypothetical protein BP01DRAFT_378475 [Aspergillus saccharolyticus JOP 1030-1]
MLVPFASFVDPFSRSSPPLNPHMLPRDRGSYWEFIFPSANLSTIGIDLSTILMPVFITTVVPSSQQGLAGGVLVPALQLGIALVLGLTDIVRAAMIKNRVWRQVIRRLLGLVSASLVFDIIGSTFEQPKQPYQPLFSTSPRLDIFKHSESQTWTGRPSILLYVLSLANAAASSSLAMLPDLIDHISAHLRHFSAMQWAVAAVVIYVLQVLPVPFERGVSNGGRIGTLLDSVLHHFKPMEPADIHLKGILWPAFVIGAEAQTTSQRALLSNVSGDLWTLWRCHNVTNALKVLKKIWVRQAMEGSSRRWIEYDYEWG